MEQQGFEKRPSSQIPTPLFLAMADAGPKLLGILPSLSEVQCVSMSAPVDQMSIKAYGGNMGNFGVPQFEKHPEKFRDS